MHTILVIDIGNTSTSYGLYRAGRVSKAGRFETAGTTATKVAARLRGYRFDGAIIASVVPRANAFWRNAVRGPIIWVNHKLDLGISVRYPKPDTIGADRLANACGAFHKYGAPIIVADFGTAVTFDVVAALRAASTRAATTTAAYIGGVIAPGLPLMFSYLAEKTAKLPLIKPGPTPHRIGKSTREAMKLGARWGYRGMMREILTELRRDPELAKATLIATGGYADWVVKGLQPRMIVDHNLTLYGLGKIYELNA